MQFAIVDGIRSKPEPRARGSCQFCGGNMVAKCGPITIWHWAHAPRRDCDPWWENETPWHREWKSYFPESWRERLHIDPTTNERHLADVKTDAGRVLEFQNSPMPLAELESREIFYGKMIWIVNGKAFKDQFHVLDALPDPMADFVPDIVFFPQTRQKPKFCFWRRSEQPNYAPGDAVRVHFLIEEEETRRQFAESYVGHHHFDWIRPRSVWFQSTKPVYIDFGDDELLKLVMYAAYSGRRLWCVQRVSKRSVVESNGGVYPAHQVL